jgi:hypothetical protein
VGFCIEGNRLAFGQGRKDFVQVEFENVHERAHCCNVVVNPSTRLSVLNLSPYVSLIRTLCPHFLQMMVVVSMSSV